MRCARHDRDLDEAGKCPECRREIQQLYARSQLEGAGLTVGPPARMAFDSFEAVTPELAQALAAAQRFAQEFNPDGGKALWLWGSYGTGKTHLAHSVQRALIRRGVRVAFRLWPAFLEELKATFDHSGETVTSLLGPLDYVDLLILDDVGKEHSPGGWAQSIAFQVVDGRYRRGKPLVVTTNYSPVEVARQLGGAVFSRLSEMSGGPVRLTGEDYRLRRQDARSY